MANAVAKRYPGEEHFVEGYVPQSMNAEYSSLHRSITWIGMGLFLASLAAWGIAIFGGATMFFDTGASAHEIAAVATGQAVADRGYVAGSFNPAVFLWGGLILAIVMDVAAIACIAIGRRRYKAYVKEHGGHH